MWRCVNVVLAGTALFAIGCGAVGRDSVPAGNAESRPRSAAPPTALPDPVPCSPRFLRAHRPRRCWCGREATSSFPSAPRRRARTRCCSRSGQGTRHPSATSRTPSTASTWRATAARRRSSSRGASAAGLWQTLAGPQPVGQGALGLATRPGERLPQLRRGRPAAVHEARHGRRARGGRVARDGPREPGAGAAWRERAGRLVHGRARRATHGQSPFVGAQTNNLKWALDLGGDIRANPVIAADGTIYVGTFHSEARAERFFAVNPDGTVQWGFPTADRISSAAAVATDGTVYVGSVTGTCTPSTLTVR